MKFLNNIEAIRWLSSTKEILDTLKIKSYGEVALIEYKILLSDLSIRSIEKSGMTVNEIVKKSQIARSKVSAIKNGALSGISSDLFFKVIWAC